MRSEDACVLQGPSASLHRGDGGEANPELDSGSSEVDVTAGIHVDSTVNEDALRVVAVVAAAAQAASIEDIPAPSLPPTKEDYLHNELNPPLVPATLILVQAVEHTVNPLTIIQMDHEQPSVPQVVSQHQQSTDLLSSDVVRVYVDDEQSTPNQQDQEEKKVKRLGYWKIFLIPVICIIVGASIGLAVGYNGGRRNEKKRGVIVPTISTVAPPTTLSPTTTFPPSRSASPSASPSCVLGIGPVWAEDYADVLSGEQTLYGASTDYGRIAFASKAYGTNSSGGETLLVLQNYNIFNDEFTLVTLVMTETGIKDKLVQIIDSIDVQSMALSDDGTTLAVGVNAYSTTAGDIGGALLLFRRLNPWTDLSWNLTHVEHTGGGINGGSPSDVAINDDGTVIAVAVTGYVGVVDAYLVVYKVKIDRLETLGDRLRDNSVDPNTDLELSGDGARLFAATSNSRIRIFDFSTQEGWSLNETLFFAGSSPSIQVSRDGNILVIGSYAWYQVKVHALIDSNWETVDAVGSIGEYGPTYSYTLSKDGSHLFLSGLYFTLDGAQKISGEWFQRRSNGFERISSVTFLVGSNVDKVHFNNDATQLLISTDFELQSFELVCDSELSSQPTVSPSDPSVSPSPTTCSLGFEEGRQFNFTNPEGADSSGIDPFISISQDGLTMTVAYAFEVIYSIQIVTFNLSLDATSMSRDGVLTGYRLNTTTLSGDGGTLLLGVNSYPQKLQDDGHVGGAFLLYHRTEFFWELHAAIETGGGSYGAVFDVASNYDGSVVAFSAVTTDGDSYVDVYAVNETGLSGINKQGFPKEEISVSQVNSTGSNLVDLGDANTTGKENSFDDLLQVVLSGSGHRLFISSRNTIRSFDFNIGCACWFQVGQSIIDESGAEFQVSYDGNTVAPTSSFFPMLVYEFRRTYWSSVEVSSDFDELGQNLTLAPALIALSRDGKTCLVTHTFYGLDTIFGDSQDNETASDGQDLFFNQTGIFLDAAKTFLEALVDLFLSDPTSGGDQAESYGHLYRKDESDTWVVVEDSTLQFPSGFLRSAFLVDDGSILVATNNGVELFRNACGD